MSHKNDKSILFIHPDYHCSFIYRDEFRSLGWRADVFVEDSYPENLLYKTEGNLKAIKLQISEQELVDKSYDVGILGKGNFFINTIIGLSVKFAAQQLKQLIDRLITFCSLLQYKYHIYYSGPSEFQMFEQQFNCFKSDGTKLNIDKSFRFALWLSKLLGIKLIYIPSGCMNIETKENFTKLDDGNVCGNCGWGDVVCNDVKNVANFNIIRKYFDMVIGTGEFESTQYKFTHLKYKALDLNLWNPDIKIPDEFKRPDTNKLRILHSFYDENRDKDGKNIKGSPFILDAVKRLENEGYPVEYYYINDVPSKYMRFYQVQADIVVEQLIYGWWGSTGVETMALGKPVVCYLRPSWKEHFLEHFKEYDQLPIVEADTNNIYDVLKKLVIDKQYRAQKGRESRLFAEKHLDVKKNTKAFEKILLNL
jgi:glycosyltransferase involved in cell wall biosynthesis